jgi:glycolate oxidase
MAGPDIKGEVLTDDASLTRFSQDMNHYRIRPKMVAVPKDEEDVATILDYAKKTATPITARGAGSNMSGVAVGKGIVVLFRDVHSVLRRQGRLITVQPGAIFGSVDKDLAGEGLRIPYDPSSRAFCTIGGNVATKASGIRSLKYGSVDHCLRSLRFVCPEHGIVDTKDGLPPRLAHQITDIRERLWRDAEVAGIYRSRADLKTSSGYNLRAFFDHEDPAAIVTHLLAGSVGTLGMFTQIELELTPIPSERVLYIPFFPSLRSAAEAALKIRRFGPSALELLDAYGTNVLRSEHAISIPAECRAVLMVEFDSDLDEADRRTRRLVSGVALGVHEEADPILMQTLWSVREGMLLRIKKDLESKDARLFSFSDDLAVPPERLPEFIADIEALFAREGMPVVIYGHAGEGNVHIRPQVPLEGWRDTMRRIADECFTTAFRYGGTITGEHGSGRNRSRYLRAEWGERTFGYFQEVKRLFDPSDLLNPGVFFTNSDVTDGLEL